MKSLLGFVSDVLIAADVAVRGMWARLDAVVCDALNVEDDES